MQKIKYKYKLEEELVSLVAILFIFSIFGLILSFGLIISRILG